MTSRKKYSWLQNSRAMLIDAYWPPINPKLKFDAEKLIRTAQGINANLIRFGTVGKYALVQNDYIPLHPELGQRDLLAEIIKASSGTDIKISAYIPVGHGLPRSLLLKQRPQWRFLMDNGGVQDGVRHFGGEPVMPVCSFGEYYDDILNFIENIINNYDIHAIYLDGPYYNWNMNTQKAICQCAKCKKAFFSETGIKLPTNRKLFGNYESNNGLLEVFNNWVGRRLYGLLQDIVLHAKRIKDLPVMFNAFAAMARPEKWERKMMEIADGFLLETELGGLRGLGVGNYYDKIIWRYTQDHTAWPRCSTSYVEKQNKHSGYETLAWGGAPIISYGGRLCLDDADPKPISELFSFMKKNEELLNGIHTNKFIGIISEKQINPVKEVATTGLTKAYDLLQGVGLQPEVIISETLLSPGELQKYPVIFLPENVDIEHEKTACIREYVHNGGIIIATGKATINEGRFLLADVFGVSLIKNDDARLESLQFWKGMWDIYLKSKNSTKLLPVHDFNWIKTTVNSQILAEIVTGEDAEVLTPAIVKNNFGKGMCFYINFPIERLYEEIGEPELIKIMSLLVKMTISREIPCEITCDNQLYSSLREKDNLKLLFLYNPTAETRTFKVNIQLKTDTVPHKVYSLVSGETIKFNIEDKLLIINQHSFDNFECIAMKF